MKNLLALLLVVVAAGAHAQASGFDIPLRPDDQNRNGIPDYKENDSWVLRERFESNPAQARAQMQLEQRREFERQARNPQRRNGLRGDRDGDGIRNRDDRYPDDPRYR